MAWTHAQQLLYLQFWLLLFWGPMNTAKGMAVWAPREVHGHLNHTVKLPCNLHSPKSSTPNVTQITWKRLAPYGEPSIVAVFHPLYGSKIQEPNRVEFAAPGCGPDLLDASLLILGLRLEDEANYTCEVTTFHSGSKSAAIWLRVFYAPQVSVSLSDIELEGHRKTTLTCDARSNPEPKRYDWSTTTGPLPPYAVPQGSRLLIQPTEESINTTFICRVSNDLGMGQAAKRVQLLETREPSHSHLALQIGLNIGIVGILLVVLGVLVYCLRRRQARQDPHRSSANGAVSYVAVEREASASQDPPTDGSRGQTDRPGDLRDGLGG